MQIWPYIEEQPLYDVRPYGGLQEQYNSLRPVDTSNGTIRRSLPFHYPGLYVPATVKLPTPRASFLPTRNKMVAAPIHREAAP